MKHFILILLALTLILPLLAESNPRPSLNQVFALEQQGRFADAIAIGQPLVDSGTLTEVQLGRACTLLGFAYREVGKFTEAQSTFERSIHIFEGKPEYVSDYASALDYIGGLYNDMEEVRAASQSWSKALHLFEQQNDHAGIARASSNLAGLALQQNKLHEAGKYLKRTAAETKLTQELDNDDTIAIFLNQAWLALLQHDVVAAAAGYQHALELCKQQHGEEHPLTGWGYMLVGKAYAEAGKVNAALENMRAGLTILDYTLGRQNLKYLVAEVAYSRALNKAGSHLEAKQIKTAADQAIKDFYRRQCIGCTISVAAFR
ncbi:MAG TPA: tetratricopeptide repeat protein [Terriglobales bacterium]|nr:tetratricopeptide repeat protein [Terriglobales bacterium]